MFFMANVGPVMELERYLMDVAPRRDRSLGLRISRFVSFPRIEYQAVVRSHKFDVCVSGVEYLTQYCFRQLLCESRRN
jgi:hypothetical protein